MPKIADFPAIGTNQRQTLGVDFGNFLPVGVTLVGTPTVQLSVTFGSDSNPQSRLVQGPSIATISPTLGGSGRANTGVTFTIANLIGGCRYVIECYCTRSDGDVAEAFTSFPSVAPG